ncbi:MAG: leucine-rich repeat domain-containing protein [Holosporales bacterium]|nr:leucine-rich repeat domain-containing protein [Holosporales bacterium]
METVGRKTFLGCFNLESVRIPAGVGKLDDECFSGCISLASVTFERDSQLKVINGSTFSYCSDLRSMRIPPSVEVFDYRCFDGCVNLREVTF